MTDDAKQAQIITLRDGRTLGFAEYGNLTGTPIICMHGTPSCRTEYRYWHSTAQKLNARLVVPDRPGVGLSTHYAGRKLLDWPEDVAQLLKHLSIDRYRVVGGSGGGPFALACAKKLPQTQMESVHVWAGAGPPESGLKDMALLGRLALQSWKYIPSFSEWFMDRFIVRVVQDPDSKALEKLVLRMGQYGDEQERALFNDKIYKEVIVDTFRETFRQGTKEALEEMRILGQDWGFKLEEVPVKGIRFYYGTKDTNTPISMGRYMQQRLKDATLREFEGKTHFTIEGEDKGEAILSDVLQQ